MGVSQSLAADNSAPRSVALRMASATRSRKPPASKVSIAAWVVPLGEVTRRRSSAASSSDSVEHARGTQHGLQRQRARGLGGQAFGDAGSDHRFGQQEDIGRAAAGHGGDRVHLRFVVDPHGLAGAASSDSATPRPLASTSVAGEQPGARRRRAAPACSASSRTTAMSPPSQRCSCAAVMPAAIDTTSGRCRLRLRRERFADARITCGLTASSPGAGIGDGVRRRCRHTITPKSRASASRSASHRFGNVDIVRGGAARDQAADQAARHVAAADEGDAVVHADASVFVGRAPNSALPMRTMVAPSSMAGTKSSLMPIDSVSMPDAAPARRRTACASPECIATARPCPDAGAGIAISPRRRNRGSAAMASARASTSVGRQPCLLVSSSMLTCSSTFSGGMVGGAMAGEGGDQLRRGPPSAPSRRRGGERPALFDCRWPIRCHSSPRPRRAGCLAQGFLHVVLAEGLLATAWRARRAAATRAMASADCVLLTASRRGCRPVAGGGRHAFRSRRVRDGGGLRTSRLARVGVVDAIEAAAGTLRRASPSRRRELARDARLARDSTASRRGYTPAVTTIASSDDIARGE